MCIALVFDRKEQSGHILFSGHVLLLKPCRVFSCLLLLFHHDVVVFVFCLYFQVRTGRQHQEERKFTLRFFSCFFLCFVSFLVFMLYVFFSFDNFLLKSKLVFFSGTKKRYGRRDDFLPRFSFFRLRFLPRFSALCWLPRQGCFS